MLFVFVLDHISDIQKLLDGSVSNDLGWIVEEVVKQSEDLPGRNLLFRLRALLLDKLDEWDELLEESNLDFRVFLGQDVERHDKTFD